MNTGSKFLLAQKCTIKFYRDQTISEHQSLFWASQFRVHAEFNLIQWRASGRWSTQSSGYRKRCADLQCGCWLHFRQWREGQQLWLLMYIILTEKWLFWHCLKTVCAVFQNTFLLLAISFSGKSIELNKGWTTYIYF